MATSIIGRTATAGDTAFVVGAVAVLVLILVHRIVGLLRHMPGFTRVTDHRCQLRQAGITRMSELHYVLYERAGGLTIVTAAESADGDIVQSDLRTAAPPHSTDVPGESG